MPGILCEHCTGHCCRHIALPIDEPENKRDFDDIRWYLVHEGVSVFVEDGEWYVNIETRCRHLQEDFRCGIYETRPKVCREYSADNCDYHSGDYGWDEHFTCAEHLKEFEREFFAQRRAKQRERGGGRGAKGRSGVRARLGRRRSRPTDYAALTSDARGAVLPILRNGR